MPTTSRIGERLRQHIEKLIEHYAARMRSDPLIPKAKELSTAQLEDHAMSFLGDVFQSLVVLERTKELADREQSELLSDGTEIQRLIADLHGRQRHRLGWTERGLEREYDILSEEVESLVKRQAPDAELTWVMDALTKQLRRAREVSLEAYRKGS